MNEMIAHERLSL